MQLAMNKQSWQALQGHGVTEESELRLDFFYVAPSEQQAKALAAFLQDETDYDVRVDSSMLAPARRRGIGGSPHPPFLSLRMRSGRGGIGSSSTRVGRRTQPPPFADRGVVTRRDQRGGRAGGSSAGGS